MLDGNGISPEVSASLGPRLTPCVGGMSPTQRDWSELQYVRPEKIFATNLPAS